MDTTASLIIDELYQGEFVPLSRGTVSRGAQLNVLALLSGNATPELMAQLRAAMWRPCGGTEADRALRAFSGFLAPDEERYGPSRDQLHEASDAFNRMVQGCPRSFLADPPGEFLALHTILNRMATAYNRREAVRGRVTD